MNSNEFLLPDELGWEANDELNALIKKKIERLQELNETKIDGVRASIHIDVFIAELIDDIYAVIKKYQEAHQDENE